MDVWTRGLRGELPCYGVYETADGQYVALGALEPHFWAAFCRAVGKEEWLGRAYDPELREEVATLFRQHTRTEWLGGERNTGILDVNEVPVAAVRALAEVADDGVLREEGVIVEDEFGRLHPALPLRFDQERPPAPTHIPKPGENSAEVEAIVKS